MIAEAARLLKENKKACHSIYAVNAGEEID